MHKALNTIEFSLRGRYAMFTDPLTKVGGEKCSYHVPTYEALKGAAKSIYWKPTFIWIVDEVRVIRRIRTQSKGVKPLNYSKGGNELSIYTYLTGGAERDGEEPGVEYQVRAHFEWNEYRPELERDRNEHKHHEIARRMLERGGRQDVFLGTRECQGYVEPCDFESGVGAYDGDPEIAFGIMFHGFDYPDETGTPMLATRFWRPVMRQGIIEFLRPDDPRMIRKRIHPMEMKKFGIDNTLKSVEDEAAALGL